jgi:hypothetical protein
MHRKFAEDYYKSRRAASSNQTTNKAQPSRTSTNMSTPCLGALTTAERTLLADHSGCFKCCRFYVSHRSKECTNGAPDASTYKTLTKVDAIAAKPKGDKTIKPVATVAPVAAVMPSNVMEVDSKSEDDTCIAPFETAHLTWPCLLTGPSLNSFERIDALIDHGSHLVLINDEVMNKLGLRRRRLHTSILVNSAFLNSPNSTLSFSEYVLLSPSSLDHDWQSRTIRAIIAPGLVVPLLLGGPFLSHNCLIIDHELWTCISKNSSYNLLNPPQRIHHVHKPILSRRNILHLCKDVIHELRNVLTTRLNETEEYTTLTSSHIAIALRNRIDTLAFIKKHKEQLDHLDAEMRQKYKDRFLSNIPHIDNLPTKIVHCIRLKDPNKIIQCRRYNTPRKY